MNGDELEDLLAMQGLSDENRRRVRVLTEAMRIIDERTDMPKMERYAAACAAAAENLPQLTRKRAGIAVPTMMRLYAAYKKTGWRALAASYARKSDLVKLPPAFVAFWQELCCEFQQDRSCAQAYRALIDRLTRWRCGSEDMRIPGFAFPPPDAEGAAHPAGWSLRNLQRKAPPKMLSRLIKHGRGDAKASFGPLVRRTRDGLEPGELIVFDDVWQDVDVMFPGSARLVRPLGLVALDVASGRQIAWGMRPRLRGADGKTAGLKAFDMEMLLTDVLCRVGTHRDGCVLAMEHGTANVSEKTEKFLFDSFKIRVERGGVDRAASFFGGFAGAFRGNSRFKAALESHHNLCHNALAFLPASTGKDRTPPENTQGMELAYAALVRRAEKEGMPRELIDKLGVGAVNWDTFCEIYAAVVARVNSRTEHDLEGWQRRLTTEVRLAEDAPWMRADDKLLVPAVLEALKADPRLHRVRRMSPDEVWRGGARALRRLKFAAFGEIFTQPDRADKSRTLDARTLRRVSDRHEFVIRPSADDPREHIFSSEIELADGGRRILEAGEAFKVLLNPFAPDELCVYDAGDGRYLGSSFRKRTRAPYNDREALLPELGAAAKEFNALAHPVNFLAAARRREIEDAAAKNRIIIAKWLDDKKRAQGSDEAARERALAAETPLLDAALRGAGTPPPAHDDDEADDGADIHF